MLASLMFNFVVVLTGVVRGGKPLKVINISSFLYRVKQTQPCDTGILRLEALPLPLTCILIR